MPWIVSQRLSLSQIEAPMHGAAAHRVADQVEVQAVAAEHAFLAEVAELGVADRAGRVAVVHRVAADARRDRPTRRRRCGSGWRPRRGNSPSPRVLVLERLVERELGAVDRLDDAAPR